MHDEQNFEPLSNWDDLRILLAVAEAGSFSGAAKRLRTTQPTISRRIESLERQLGVRLLDRVPSGVGLTSEGETVLETARTIEMSLIDTRRRVLGADQRLEGKVRISLTEGLATFWVSPQVGEFQEAYPGISVEFQASGKPADILNLQSDLSICFRKPDAPDLIATKLGSLHGIPWASPDYLEAFGIPTTPEDLRDHRLLDHEFYHTAKQSCAEWVALLGNTRHRRYSTDSSSSLLSATQNSVGIALLPTYFCEFADNIIPLDLGLVARFDFWLTYHPDVRHSARIRATIEWIKSLFDQEAWRWFRDEFHPPKLSTRAQGKQPTESGVPSERGLNGRAAHISEEAKQG